MLVFIGHRLKLTCAGHNNISLRTGESVKSMTCIIDDARYVIIWLLLICVDKLN
jgi:hypothetical protein